MPYKVVTTRTNMAAMLLCHTKIVTTRTNMAAMLLCLTNSNYMDKHGSYVTMPYK